MTLHDLFTGHWTWLQLMDEIAPLLFVAVSMYFAGYQRGSRIELERTIRILEGKRGA